MYSIAHNSENWLKITRIFLFFPGLCPALLPFALQSRDCAAGTRMPWHPVPLLYYKESTLFYVVCFAFFNEEYLIALVDFIVALRRTKGRGRRILRSPSPPWNHACVAHWTPPPHPRGVRCGGALLLPRAWGNIGFLHPVLSLIPSSECCAAICVRAGIVRVSVGLFGYGRSFFIIGGRGRSCLRLRGVLLFLS